MTHRTVAILAAGVLAVFGCNKSEANPDRPSTKTGLDAAKIERLTGAKGTLDEKSGVFKVTAPRKDLAVTVGERVKLTPPQGLTSWAAFQAAGDHAIVMGDVVLTEDQVNPVMSAALDAGLEVTGLHNHFLWEKPRIMFMHIAGMGDERQLARAVGEVLSVVDETKGGKGEPAPAVDIDPAKTSLDTTKLDAILGQKGDYKDGVYKVTVGRTTNMGEVRVGNAMGVNTWAAFAGTDDRAIVDGDFAMRESELQTVLKTLRAANIDIVAIHQHMVGEQPRIMFLHFWGEGRAEDLARGVKAALDTQAK